MSAHLPPFVCEPLLHAKPWGGRRLESFLGKTLPAAQPTGEAWELVSLPGAESRVRSGPLKGRTLEELVTRQRRELIGGVELVAGRFPLLIKYLDARENLSIQVHPKPDASDPFGLRPGIKHEAWYVVAAEPGAELLIGAKPGVTAADFAAAAGTARLADLLEHWPAQPGQCYYLPSGTPHALGAGVLVAEVQTPSDITYRLYDWDRKGLDGRPRELHLEQGLQNVRCDVSRVEIAQAHASADRPVRRLATCQRFVIDERRFSPQPGAAFSVGRMHIWMVLDGAGAFRGRGGETELARGDTVVIPALCSPLDLHITHGLHVLDITIPAASA